MRTYQYAAKTAEGNPSYGTIVAEDENEAAARLREKYEIIVSIRERKGIFSLTGTFAPGKGRAYMRPFLEMCRGFESLLGAGVTIESAVHLLSEETGDRSLRRILVLTQTELSNGSSFVEALRESAGDRFPEALYEILSVGEKDGDLKGAFGKCGDFFEKHTELEDKKRSALLYPAFVLLCAIAFFVILMLTAVPAFLAVYRDLGESVPALVQVLGAISDFVRHTWLIIVIVIASLIAAYLIMRLTAKGDMLLSRLRLLLPWMGKTERCAVASLLFDSQQLLFQNGKTLSEATGLSAELMTNARARAGLEEIQKKQEEGETFLSSFEHADFLPESIGEIIGEIDENDREGTLKALSSAAEFYDAELQRVTRKEVSVLSTILIVLILITAGFTVVSVYFSMFGIYRAVL